MDRVLFLCLSVPSCSLLSYTFFPSLFLSFSLPYFLCVRVFASLSLSVSSFSAVSPPFPFPSPFLFLSVVRAGDFLVFACRICVCLSVVSSWVPLNPSSRYPGIRGLVGGTVEC